MLRVILIIGLVALAVAAVVFQAGGRPKDLVFRAVTGETIRVRLREHRVIALEFDHQGRTYVAPVSALSGLEEPVFSEARVSRSRPFEKLPTVSLSFRVKLQPGDRVVGTKAACLFSPEGEFRRLTFDPQVTVERLAEEIQKQRARKKTDHAPRSGLQAVTYSAGSEPRQP